MELERKKTEVNTPTNTEGVVDTEVNAVIKHKPAVKKKFNGKEIRPQKILDFTI